MTAANIFWRKTEIRNCDSVRWVPTHTPPKDEAIERCRDPLLFPRKPGSGVGRRDPSTIRTGSESAH